MRHTLLFTALCLAAAPLAASAADIENWPTKYTFGDGTEAALTGNFAFDLNQFSGDDRLEDRDDFRRKEFGLTVKKKGVYDAMVYFDFESKLWLDVFFRFETKALFGQDYGRVRLGYIKVPVGLEGVQSSRASSLMELGLPIQAIFQGRRPVPSGPSSAPATCCRPAPTAARTCRATTPAPPRRCMRSGPRSRPRATSCTWASPARSRTPAATPTASACRSARACACVRGRRPASPMCA